MSTASANTQSAITIVTPSFEKHIVQYGEMIESLYQHCLDIDQVNIVLIVEQKNHAAFSELLAKYPRLSSKIVLTEDVLKHFGATETPIEFLLRAGKFTFQSLKKFGGLLQAETEWSLILDSETVFCNEFSMAEVLDNYRQQKYVFYTETEPRGDLWTKGDAHQVNANTEAVLGVNVKNYWFMENFHWFYEKEKVQDLLENRVGALFHRVIQNKSYGKFDLFENILYYSYLRAYHAEEYNFIDFKDALVQYLPEDVAARFSLSKLPFSLFGNDYLLNILQPSEIHCLSDLFAQFKIPFLRLEPPFFHTAYLKNLRKLPFFIATISSHHQIWLKKKIAVCVSGEFRHLIHRVPEQQVRFLKSFLSGVECDVFIHGWSDPSEALIIHELQPKRYLFEEAPSFEELAGEIRYREALIKDKRDQGSLLMFYSMQKAFELIGDDRDNYDYVVRIRPDIFMEKSLKEILISISDEGDFQPEAIYIPSHFHSKGINDQFAIGRIERMASYFHTLEYARLNLEKFAFNPEMFLLRSILDSGASICLVDAPYALLRHLPMRIGEIHHALEAQRHVWWSRHEGLPLHVDISEFLIEKLRSMEGVMVGQIKGDVYLRDSEGTIIEAKVIDYDPMWHCCAFRSINGLMTAFHFNIVNSNVVPSLRPSQTMFVFRDGDNIVLSQWELSKGKLRNEKIVFGDGALKLDWSPGEGVLALAWRLNRHLIDGEPLRERQLGATVGVAHGLMSVERSLATDPQVDDMTSNGIGDKIVNFSEAALAIKSDFDNHSRGLMKNNVLGNVIKSNNIFQKFVAKAFFRLLYQGDIQVYTLKTGMRSNSLLPEKGVDILEPSVASHVLFGPYIKLNAGKYRAEFYCDSLVGDEVVIDVRSSEQDDIARRTINLKHDGRLAIEWTISHKCSDVEIRLFAHQGFRAVFNCLLIRRD